MEINLEVLIIVVLTLVIVALLLINRENNKSTGVSYPAETKNILAVMTGTVVYLASRTENTADDKAAEILVTVLAGMGINVPLPEPVIAEKPGPESQTKADGVGVG